MKDFVILSQLFLKIIVYIFHNLILKMSLEESSLLINFTKARREKNN